MDHHIRKYQLLYCLEGDNLERDENELLFRDKLSQTGSRIMAIFESFHDIISLLERRLVELQKRELQNN